MTTNKKPATGVIRGAGYDIAAELYYNPANTLFKTLIYLLLIPADIYLLAVLCGVGVWGYTHD